MQTLIVDPSLRAFLPRQDEETRKLEESLRRDGVKDNLVVWKDKNIIVDGMTRYELCLKHGIQYEHRIEYREFANLEDVKIWMMETQLARRNLNIIQKKYFRGKLYNSHKAANAGRPIGKVAAKGETRERIGRQEGVSGRTIQIEGKFARALDVATELIPEIKDLVFAGKFKVKMNVLTAELSRIAKLTITDAKKRLEEIINGKPPASEPEIEDGTIHALESQTELQERLHRAKNDRFVRISDAMSSNGMSTFYPFVREPRQEQDVIVLFSMAISRGMFPYQILGVSSIYRYDCFLQFTKDHKELPVVAEFKFKGESIWKDLTNRKEKARYGQLHLLICWTINTSWLRQKDLRIEKAKQGKQHLPGATHVLSLPKALGFKDSPIDVICLSDLLKLED
jgi:hypothetical protein